MPAEYEAQRLAGAHRVPECQTPVFLWVEPENGIVRLYAHVAEEAPTVQGFVAILVEAFDGGPAEALAAAPADLVYQLGLADLLRMNRAVGLSAVISRMKREAAALMTRADANASTPLPGAGRR